MTVDSDFLSLERVLFFTGQRLTAEDLTAAQNVNREMRWLHNRSLHQWGIGAGMAVTGEKGAREIVVAPGYALDARGREIVLGEARTLPVPPLAGKNGGPAILDLTISYPSDSEIEVTETREGICLPAGAVRLSEVPILRWLETSQVRTGFDIILARVAIRNCELDSPLSLTQRRNARPPQQPKVACGITLEGETSWKAWVEQIKLPSEGGETEGQIILGFETEVDTTAAHFLTTPSYLARVAGGRLVRANSDFKKDFLVDGFAHVINARPQSFTLQVFMVPRDEAVSDGKITLNPDDLFDPNREKQVTTALQRIWNVVWIGVEG